MKKRIGSYPCVRVEGGGRGVISQAGPVLLVETVRKSGLDAAISAALEPWRKPRAVHDPGKILLDVALAVALGGDCLADVGMLRAESAVFGPVASDPTVSRLISKLASGGQRVLAALRTARAEVRERVWRLAGAAAPDADGQVIVDIDGVLVLAHSDHGVQFTSWAFTERARVSGLVPSMGTIGDCYDNAMIESFWGRMQTELLNRRRWRTRLELANAIFEYLEIFHNRQRRHSALGMLTPVEFELRKTPSIA
ncbi:transposase [Streptomyces sp. NPDC003393]